MRTILILYLIFLSSASGYARGCCDHLHQKQNQDWAQTIITSLYKVITWEGWFQCCDVHKNQTETSQKCCFQLLKAIVWTKRLFFFFFLNKREFGDRSSRLVSSISCDVSLLKKVSADDKYQRATEKQCQHRLSAPLCGGIYHRNNLVSLYLGSSTGT